MIKVFGALDVDQGWLLPPSPHEFVPPGQRNCSRTPRRYSSLPWQRRVWRCRRLLEPTKLLPAPASDPAPTVSGQKLRANSVAQKLKAKSGSEMTVAAAATLQLYDEKQTFTRTELLDTMKKATMHRNANISSNLTKILGTLVGSKFNQISDGV